ncbi:MAG: hypothetical protein WBP64_06685 [Nitrososphaeraceae archaeon]
MHIHKHRPVKILVRVDVAVPDGNSYLKREIGSQNHVIKVNT